MEALEPAMTEKPPLTEWLQQWQAGDQAALARLVDVFYPQLRRMAERYMQQENPGHTIQATALVHEAVVRIIDIDIDWQDRTHFLAVMGKTMRRYLVDHARARQRNKRGDGLRALNIDDLKEIAIEDNADLLDLNEALQQLGQEDPRKESVVELTYFAGLTQQEVAEVLNISETTVVRDLRMARALLKQALANR